MKVHQLCVLRLPSKQFLYPAKTIVFRGIVESPYPSVRVSVCVQKILVYSLASTNINQSAPNLVKKYGLNKFDYGCSRTRIVRFICP